jgi:hypothetical protein
MIARELSKSDKVPVELLSTIFRLTTTSYKHFFNSLIRMLAKDGFMNGAIRLEHLIPDFLASAWHPLFYFRLSFGRQDQVWSCLNELLEDLGSNPDHKSLHKK